MNGDTIIVDPHNTDAGKHIFILGSCPSGTKQLIKPDDPLKRRRIALKPREDVFSMLRFE